MRTRKCGECEACLRERCGECLTCRDRICAGGTGKHKGVCRLKKCKNRIEVTEDDIMGNDEVKFPDESFEVQEAEDDEENNQSESPVRYSLRNKNPNPKSRLSNSILVTEDDIKGNGEVKSRNESSKIKETEDIEENNQIDSPVRYSLRNKKQKSKSRLSKSILVTGGGIKRNGEVKSRNESPEMQEAEDVEEKDQSKSPVRYSLRNKNPKPKPKSRVYKKQIQVKHKAPTKSNRKTVKPKSRLSKKQIGVKHKSSTKSNKKVVTRKCGECKACLRERCGDCTTCRSLISAGGTGKHQGVCRLKRCKNRIEVFQQEQETISSVGKVIVPSPLDYSSQEGKSTKINDNGEKRGPKKARKKMMRCKECENCLRENCNKCRYCVDRVSNGRKAIYRSTCNRRRCKNHIENEANEADSIASPKGYQKSDSCKDGPSKHRSRIGEQFQATDLPTAGSFDMLTDLNPSHEGVWNPKTSCSSIYQFLDEIGSRCDLEPIWFISRYLNYDAQHIKRLISDKSRENDIKYSKFHFAMNWNNGNLDAVAKSLRKDIDAVIWFFLHRYKASMQWRCKQRQHLFHQSFNKNRRAMSVLANETNENLGSCLWYYYNKYKKSPNYLSFKEEKVGLNHSDECMICKDGGDLLCCDSCNNTCHLSCISPPLKSMPIGNWFCTKCKKKNLSSSPNSLKLSNPRKTNPCRCAICMDADCRENEYCQEIIECEEENMHTKNRTFSEKCLNSEQSRSGSFDEFTHESNDISKVRTMSQSHVSSSDGGNMLLATMWASQQMF